MTFDCADISPRQQQFDCHVAFITAFYRIHFSKGIFRAVFRSDGTEIVQYRSAGNRLAIPLLLTSSVIAISINNIQFKY